MRLLVAISLCALVASSSYAETLKDDAAAAEYRVSGGLFLGGHLLSNQSELGNSFFDDQVPENAFLFGLRGGYVLIPELAPGGALNPSLSIELESELSMSRTIGLTMRESEFSPILGLRGNLLMEFFVKNAVSPFLLVGGGAETLLSSSKFAKTPDTDALVHVGLGAFWDMSSRYGLRADVRAGVMAARDDGVAPLYEAHLGVYYRFDWLARHPEPLLAVATTPPQPEPAAEPTPEPAPVVEPTPEPAPVVEPTPEPAPDLKDWSHKVPSIRFPNGGSRLSLRSSPVLNELVAVLEAHPNATVAIYGHTDDIGGTSQNRRLSQRRADAVKKYLVSHGIDAKRVTAKGFGMAKPIASNNSKSGRAKNRRIEVQVTP